MKTEIIQGGLIFHICQVVAVLIFLSGLSFRLSVRCFFSDESVHYSMIILSCNTYFTLGISALLEQSMDLKPTGYDRVVIYDRGDDIFSVIHYGDYCLLHRHKMSFYQYLLCRFPTFDCRKSLRSDMNEYLQRSIRSAMFYRLIPDKRNKLTDRELLLLHSFFSGDTINDIAKRTPGVNLVTFRSRKNQALRKLGHLSAAKMVKLLHNWEHFFNYSHDPL